MNQYWNINYEEDMITHVYIITASLILHIPVSTKHLLSAS